MLDEKWLPSDPVKGDFYAIGSGADFALGAMAAGKTACGAVQVACELDVWSGGEVQTVSHNV